MSSWTTYRIEPAATAKNAIEIAAAHTRRRQTWPSPANSAAALEGSEAAAAAAAAAAS
jgi:hypothetical protein